ncbi:MAG: hypothetical protein JW969_13535 [Spirochaetales bacterium]|nr:hypothetical protein [Spirochaetales bacterium]
MKKTVLSMILFTFILVNAHSLTQDDVNNILADNLFILEPTILLKTSGTRANARLVPLGKAEVKNINTRIITSLNFANTDFTVMFKGSREEIATYKAVYNEKLDMIELTINFKKDKTRITVYMKKNEIFPDQKPEYYYFYSITDKKKNVIYCNGIMFVLNAG